MQPKEQNSSDFFLYRILRVNILPHVIHFFSTYASLYLHFFEQYILRFPPRGYFLIKVLSQILHLSIKPLNKGSLLCH